MDKLELKRKLVEECRQQLQKTVNNLQSAMDEAQQSANEYGPPKDRYDSFRMQQLRKKDMFGQQIKKSLDELYALEKIDLKTEMIKAGFGAVVLTNEQKIFISIGLGKLTLDNEIYYAVSVHVPLALALEGKQKGDIYEINGKKLEILDVF
jgi:transcription elongation GreA/GreB family factor